jgi:hypothetical protein
MNILAELDNYLTKVATRNLTARRMAQKEGSAWRETDVTLDGFLGHLEYVKRLELEQTDNATQA